MRPVTQAHSISSGYWLCSHWQEPCGGQLNTDRLNSTDVQKVAVTILGNTKNWVNAYYFLSYVPVACRIITCGFSSLLAVLITLCVIYINNNLSSSKCFSLFKFFPHKIPADRLTNEFFALRVLSNQTNHYGLSWPSYYGVSSQKRSSQYIAT